jgi:Spy/CpxP family protein refolding chaperone
MGGRGMGHPGMGMGQGMGGPGMGMGRGMGGPGMGGPLGPMCERLQLTEAQRGKLADIRDRQQRRGIQAHADLQIAQLDLRKLMHSEKPDGAAINAQIDRIARVRTELAKARVAGMLEARALLTPEQQKQLRELHAGGPGGPGCGMGPGGGMGAGGECGGMAPGMGAGGECGGMAPGAGKGKGHPGMMRMRMHGQSDSTRTDSQ